MRGDIKPFNKIEAGLDRARLRQAHWRDVAARFAPGTPEQESPYKRNWCPLPRGRIAGME